MHPPLAERIGKAQTLVRVATYGPWRLPWSRCQVYFKRIFLKQKRNSIMNPVVDFLLNFEQITEEVIQEVISKFNREPTSNELRAYKDLSEL